MEPSQKLLVVAVTTILIYAITKLCNISWTKYDNTEKVYPYVLMVKDHSDTYTAT